MSEFSIAIIILSLFILLFWFSLRKFVHFMVNVCFTKEEQIKLGWRKK